jgi:hypothetical protein
MCINFQISPCKSSFQAGFKNTSGFWCLLLSVGFFVSSRCQVGFNKEKRGRKLMAC